MLTQPVSDHKNNDEEVVIELSTVAE
jgi:putative protein kinase ArgK-like GTPase of G3E family